MLLEVKTALSPAVHPAVTLESVWPLLDHARTPYQSSDACVVTAGDPALIAVDAVVCVVPAELSTGLAAHPVELFHSSIVQPYEWAVAPHENVKLVEPAIPAVTTM